MSPADSDNEVTSLATLFLITWPSAAFPAIAAAKSGPSRERTPPAGVSLTKKRGVEVVDALRGGDVASVDNTTNPSLHVKATTRLEKGSNGAETSFAIFSTECNLPVGEKTVGGNSSYVLSSCNVLVPDEVCQGAAVDTIERRGEKAKQRMHTSSCAFMVPRICKVNITEVLFAWIFHMLTLPFSPWDEADMHWAFGNK